MFIFLGKLLITVLVFFAVIFGLDKYWIKNTSFENGGSGMMWVAFITAFVMAGVVYVIL